MRGGQVGPALLTAGYDVLQLPVIALGLLGARERLLVGRVQPAGLLLGRSHPAARRTDLVAHLGKPFRALRGGARLGGETPLRLGERGLGGGPLGHDLAQLIAADVKLLA